MYEFLWFFFIYAFLGWCLEVSFVALTSGRFVNRGFLNGPVCPIYGFGATLLIYLLTPLRHSLILFFVCSVALTTVLELLVGVLLEKLFHQRWWDYSNMPFHFKGYICPLFSLMWGIACLVVVGFIHPPVGWLVGKIPHLLGIGLLLPLCALMAVDLAATIRTIAKINRDLGQIDDIANRMHSISDELGETLATHAIAAAEKSSDIKEDFEIWKDAQDEKQEMLIEKYEAWKDVHEERQEARKLAFEAWKADMEEQQQDWKALLSEWRDASKERTNRIQLEAQIELQELREKLDHLLTQSDRGRSRMLRAFPTMRSLYHSSALERLRRRLDHSNNDETSSDD